MAGRFFAPVTTIPRYPRTSSPGSERRPAANLRALLPRDDQYRRFSNPGGVAVPALKWSPTYLVALIRAGRSSRTASWSNDPTNQQAVTLTPHDRLIHRP
jgi:hypothetical protein